MYYLIKAESEYLMTISKWEDDSSYPIQIYQVKREKNYTCTCISFKYRSYCKHITYVKQWIEEGSPEGKQYE